MQKSKLSPRDFGGSRQNAGHTKNHKCFTPEKKHKNKGETLGTRLCAGKLASWEIGIWLALLNGCLLVMLIFFLLLNFFSFIWWITVIIPVFYAFFWLWFTQVLLRFHKKFAWHDILIISKLSVSPFLFLFIISIAHFFSTFSGQTLGVADFFWYGMVLSSLGLLITGFSITSFGLHHLIRWKFFTFKFK